jgi:hypothetical protein
MGCRPLCRNNDGNRGADLELQRTHASQKLRRINKCRMNETIMDERYRQDLASWD